MESILDTTSAALREDLDAVEGLIDGAFRVEGVLMQEVADYVREGRGKRLRPLMTCLTARLFDPAGHHGENRRRIAAAAETIHTATLLHDDVIDKSSLRRGRETVNARWGDDVAILMADYLYATAYDLLLSTLRPEAIRVFARVTRDMTFGEMLQIETRERWLEIEEYLKIIRCKTAYLFGACAGLGATIAGADPTNAERATRYGIHYGMAFQLTDDALDYDASDEHWGKRLGNDLEEGKQTLPLLHTFLHATPEDREALTTCLGNGRDFQIVQGYVARYDGVGATRNLARDYVEKALADLDGMILPREPLSAADRADTLQSLRALARHVVFRQR